MYCVFEITHAEKFTEKAPPRLWEGCLDAVRLWPGRETLGGIQIVREDNGRFSVRVTLYGRAKRRIADRAMNAVQREQRRCFHLLE